MTNSIIETLLEAFDTIITSKNPEVQKMLQQLILLAQLSADNEKDVVNPFKDLHDSLKTAEKQIKRLGHELNELRSFVKLNNKSQWNPYNPYDIRYDIKY